jgi:uncharacterized protein
MIEDKNVETLRAAYLLWNDSKANSVEHWLDLIHEDVDWRSLADGAHGMEFTGRRKGKEAVKAFSASR